jgi:aerobic carbon-monoxide dehydrogenase medium subunit
VITTEFSYQRAGSVDEALRLLAASPEATLVAGGHSLIPSMKLRVTSASALVDISGIAALKGVSRAGDGFRIGAATTHRDVAESTDLRSGSPLLAEVAGVIGDPAVRNRGTIGGSLAHADPAADYPAAIIALGAQIEVTGTGGSRTIAADDFFTGTFETAVAGGEMITAVTVPAAAGVAYEKFVHPASGYAVVGVAAVVTVAGGTISSVRVGVTGAGPQALRLTGLESALAGKAADDATLRAVCSGLVAAGDLVGDHQASAAYRASLVDTLARRAIARAAARG